MSALAVDHTTANGHEWDDLVRIWQETDAPEGCEVEIIEGIVTVAPPPSVDGSVFDRLVHGGSLPEREIHRLVTAALS